MIKSELNMTGFRQDGQITKPTELNLFSVVELARVLADSRVVDITEGIGVDKGQDFLSLLRALSGLTEMYRFPIAAVSENADSERVYLLTNCEESDQTHGTLVDALVVNGIIGIDKGRYDPSFLWGTDLNISSNKSPSGHYSSSIIIDETGETIWMINESDTLNKRFTPRGRQVMVSILRKIQGLTLKISQTSILIKPRFK